MPDDTTEIDPSELDPYLKPRAAGLIIPPTGTTPPPDMEIDPSELGPYVAGPITSHDNPTLSRSKEPAWFPYVDEPTKIAAQVGGELIGEPIGTAAGAVGGGLLGSEGGPIGTVAGAGTGAVVGGGIGAATGAGTGQVIQAEAMNLLKRGMGYDPDSVNPKEQFEAGAAGTLGGKYILPMAVKYLGAPAARRLFGITSLTDAGESAVRAQQEAIDKYGSETIGPTATKVQAKAEQTAAEQWAARGLQERMGTTPMQVAGKTSATTDAEALASKTLRARSRESIIGMVDQPRSEYGQAIGNFWSHRIDERVPTLGYDDLATGLKNPVAGTIASGPVSKRVSGLLDQMEVMGPETRAGQVLDMKREADALMRTTRSPRERQILSAVRERLDDTLGDDEFLSPEAKAELRPLNDSYSGIKREITQKDYDAINAATTPAGQFEAMTKMDRRGLEEVVRRGTQDSENKATLREAATDYFVGEDPKDLDGIRNRVDETYAKSPTAYRQLFAGTPMEDPRAMARVPYMAAKMSDALSNDPKFATYYEQAFKQELDTPNGKVLQNEMQKYGQMPDPESMRQGGINDALRKGTASSGMWRYLNHRVMFDGMIAVMSAGRYGMIARNPAIAITLGGALVSREFLIRNIRNHPEAYWNFISSIGKGATPEAARYAGKWAADLAIMTAIDGMHHKAQAARDVATSAPEPVTGVPSTDPNAVAVP